MKDGTSWTARIEDDAPESASERRAGWEAVLFEMTPAARAARLVYRPAGWLEGARLGELLEALEEAAAVRARWQPEE